MFKLRSWIDETKLTKELSCNPNAVEYLEEHPEKIDYSYITLNVNAIHIIEKIIDRCDIYALYEELNANPNITNLLRNNQQLLSHSSMCYYEHGIEFIEELIKNNKLDAINWTQLSFNSAAVHILEQYQEKINWSTIIYNDNAEHLIRNNLEKVEKYWYNVCSQPHLISLIEERPEKIDWFNLSGNENAEHLLKNNLEKIYIDYLCENKNGFELLMLLNHRFDNDHYHENIVYKYFDYCTIHNIAFTLIKQLCKYGYTEEHFEFIKSHTLCYKELSQNPNIFVYDYSRMKKTRQQQLWYWDIKK